MRTHAPESPRKGSSGVPRGGALAPRAATQTIRPLWSRAMAVLPPRISRCAWALTSCTSKFTSSEHLAGGGSLFRRSFRVVARPGRGSKNLPTVGGTSGRTQCNLTDLCPLGENQLRRTPPAAPSGAPLQQTCRESQPGGKFVRAEVAELADAHGSGPCARKGVGVRVPSSAPECSSPVYLTACINGTPGRRLGRLQRASSAYGARLPLLLVLFAFRS